MIKIYSHVFKLSLAFFLLLSSWSYAGTVAYPSLQQPGAANIAVVPGGWKFSNNLLSANYIQTGAKLYFGGSTEMCLGSGTEIFQIALSNGTVVNASQMTWLEVKAVDLVGNPSSATYSEKLNGKALMATLTYNTLTFKWRAVLRDGSHYLRTELEISTTANTPMLSITPMLYKVYNKDGRPAPVVVGNTRGAVVASENIFAGLETPLGINSTTSSKPAVAFNPNSWAVESWMPLAAAAPSPVLNFGFTQDQIVTSQGDVEVSSAGSLVVTFQYVSGSHRLNMVGVDLLKNGVVVASDYHVGYTGGAKLNNVYTVNVSSAGTYTLRYLVETKTETITSTGTIACTGPSVAAVKYFNPNSWTASLWTAAPVVPSSILALGFNTANILSMEGNATISKAGNVLFTFQYSSGVNRLNITGVDVLDKTGTVLASDYHIGSTGTTASNNMYSLNIPLAGTYKLRYFAENKTEPITSSGLVSFTNASVSMPGDDSTMVVGKWSRNTTLQTTDTFKVSSVIGLVAEGQRRRSFLAYHERERAVPWRSFVLYNSWYELDINLNNNTDPLQRMTETMCLPVMNAWKTNLYDAYGVGIDAFVWDDGWDDFNSLWSFHIGFPYGFKNLNRKSLEQGAGTGAWLGPVGGYGSAKAQRLAFWNSTHSPAIGNFQLSNKEYFDAFTGRCAQMVNDYDMRFFKFDGISAIGNATGPANEEDAEGIINVLKRLRQKRNDIFFNCTVGTWASPFWFHYGDAVWRQDNDWAQVGTQGDAREKWITYRDELVYRNFITNSPLCPINSLMTHGLIVSKNGPPAAMPRDNSVATKNGIIREMRCAFACGSGMVELYVDNDLMSSIGNKALWAELASCIKWHRANKEVLADTHWVGGNPWDGTKVNVYGWAAWSPAKSTFALRNPSASAATYSTTLRTALDIPAYVTGKMHLTNAFINQTNYVGISNADVDIDAPLTFNMPASDVVVFDLVPVDINNAIKDKLANINAAIVYGSKNQIMVKNIDEQSTVKVANLAGILVGKVLSNDRFLTLEVPQVGVYVVQIYNPQGKLVQTEKVICQ